MKKTRFLSAIALFPFLLQAQVPKKVVVEHFTNTVCSICASRNPGFYTNYSNQTGVIHFAVHPSSPYSSCQLNQHNVAENDGRTNYYGIYGSTPRLVIQGVNISTSANYSASALFTPYLNQTAPASIRITQTNYGNDSIRSRIVVKTEAAHQLGGLQLFVALAEDTVFYASPNGESEHYDVFRKSLTGTSGVAITLPATVGDSVVYTMSSLGNSAWDISRIYTLAILQETSSKAVVQAESTLSSSSSGPNGVAAEQTLASTISVLVANGELLITQTTVAENRTVVVVDLAGKVLLRESLREPTDRINLSGLAAGLYVYAILENEQLLKTGKVVLQ